jgi:hypothetical protein
MLKALDANEVISTSLEAFFISIPWFAWQISALLNYFLRKFLEGEFLERKFLGQFRARLFASHAQLLGILIDFSFSKYGGGDNYFSLLHFFQVLGS